MMMAFFAWVCRPIERQRAFGIGRALLLGLVYYS